MKEKNEAAFIPLFPYYSILSFPSFPPLSAYTFSFIHLQLLKCY